MGEGGVVIVGSGLAALTVAYYLPRHENVMIFTKKGRSDSNSWRAQGGVAAALAEGDGWRSHFHDTMTAGCLHNDERMVELIVREGPERLQEWMNAGMAFDLDESGRISVGLEGGHSFRRILHAGGDQTGKALVSFLLQQLNDRVPIVEGEQVIDLLIEDGRCVGVKTKREDGRVSVWRASAVVLASGGCAGLYTFTSNAPTATGDGIAMAYRAGAAVADMEFIQFHPTMLAAMGKAVGLVSEAVRGEGAVLETEDGRRVMDGVHPLGDLAPRDIVARAIAAEIDRGGCVYLNISAVPHFRRRFPTIAALCEAHGIDWEAGRLPVVPGAHFVMGGIVVNEWGQTTVPGLYAVGEAACTGVHGANRLASNSLLEAIVFGFRAACAIRRQAAWPETVHRADSSSPRRLIVPRLPERALLREQLSTFVGIVRNGDRLREAVDWLEQFSLPDWLDGDLERLSAEEIETGYMLLVGWLVASSALGRTESRGGHYRSDFPRERPEWRGRRLVRTKEEWARLGAGR
ncbi:L-aspartate oxidase [Geobacillus stearothermophilus]|uniref:L-aspartate oxidase n=1 Tax=unclassified Geobacillus TaxID=2642459 RepID=UPI0005CD09F1|nr:MULTISPECIES: L-aspartate oxidase [unclassified Geobacillus]AKM19902.1 L-aspartate oxidase [Geobacillus sp. 12AMOR1]AKU25904.1 L-aspartate oxidase [Geobacillus sp. LC300]KZE94984.1 L-aspartate oxidase [Geobacillus stearothermophilus]NNU98761.1 L-aspartate oxidase [Geobacillus sp. DSP4a]PJW15761.1 L-aspartate oxidase [Geobacillus sp. Manikaran-105]